MRPVLKSRGTGNEEINLSKIWDLFENSWYYVVVTLAISILACWLYLRYTKPLFMAVTTVRVEEDKSPGRGLGMLENFGFGPFRDNIQSEIQLLRSRSIVTVALSEMDISAAYYLVGTLVTAEMYKDDSPFIVSYDSTGKVAYNKMFSLFYLGGNKFKLVYTKRQESVEGQYYFGETINIDGFKFQVVKRETARYSLVPGIEYRWQAIKWKSLVGRALGGLKVEQSGYLVPILKVSQIDFVAKFASDFLNTLMKVYEKEDISRKQQAATQALDFIAEQLDTIKSSVNSAEQILQEFKQDKEFISVDLKVGFDMESMKRNAELQSHHVLKLMEINRLSTDIARGNRELSLPYSIEGQTDPILTSLISSYNGLVQEKLAALQSYTASHPKVKEMDSKLEELRFSISENIASIKNNTEQKIGFYKAELSKSRNNLQSIPQTQRIYQGLMREHKVKESILSTLLEKQAEAQIAKASIVSSVYILDRALTPRAPISPLAQKVYIIGCGLGVCLGLLLILLSGMLKNTVSYREEVENMSVTPIIGVVRRSNESLKQKYPLLKSVEHPKSSLSESIRAIRTNMQFINSEKEEGSKIVSITSTVSGEGKSFITINLGGIISLLNVKVVILDMDLRKPKLHFSFGHDNSAGVSTYLVNQNTLPEILTKTQYKNLDIITSGPIPPNPAELIQSNRMTELLDELRKQYDYILIDTPPIGLVTDGTTILKLSDIALYVIRADYSKKSFASNPDQLVEDHDIKNLYIVLNSVSAANRRYGGYGYKVYGSGYYSDDKPQEPWWKFWKKLRS
ncbi:MAG TPA: polysaccharide biosynthesis tyrosine autokinase [Bacteroidetes bacterium]|nr:polysaccharide biosynthesis tyrosine autokinase [Bacteroidota bacterium]